MTDYSALADKLKASGAQPGKLDQEMLPSPGIAPAAFYNNVKAQGILLGSTFYW